MTVLQYSKYFEEFPDRHCCRRRRLFKVKEALAAPPSAGVSLRLQMSMVELEGEDPMLDVIRKIERIRIAQSEKPESVTSKVRAFAQSVRLWAD